MAKRSPGAAVIVPSVVNWKLNHYAALVEQKTFQGTSSAPARRCLFIPKIPLSEHETWLSQKVLDAESSGYFLVPKGSLPPGWRTVGAEEASKVWGKGFVINRSPRPPCPPMGGNGGSSGGVGQPSKPCGSPGMPTADIDLTQVSATMTDTPLSYPVPVGPSMNFTISYDSQSAYGGNPNNATTFGGNWNP